MPEPASARLSRRGLLTMAAAATLPAACSRRSPPDLAGPNTPGASSAAPTATSGTGDAPATPAVPSPPPAAGKPAVPALRGGPVAFRPGHALLGSYLGLRGLSLEQSLALRRKQLGREQRIVHVFYDWTDTLPQERPDIGDASTLLISWMGTHYAEINGGSADKRIAAEARRLAAHRQPTLLRWGWEMNGNWFSWDGTHNGRKPGGYVKAWKRLHKIFRDEGADNVAWVWSPNWNSGPDVSWNQYQHYYPGDSYVDWVGVSAYPFNKQTPKTLFHQICAEYGSTKPVMLTETAAIDHGGHTKADWIRDFNAYVMATPSIGGVVWFDTDVQPGTKENFRIDSSKSVLAAYRAMARGARFSG